RMPSLHRISLKSLEQVSSLERMSKTSMRKTGKNQPQKSYLRAKVYNRERLETYPNLWRSRRECKERKFCHSP
ncbi:MAG: hypothetical protein QXR19_18130, partial [Candidatus Jordarchaeaceae archaeon]